MKNGYSIIALALLSIASLGCATTPARAEVGSAFDPDKVEIVGTLEADLAAVDFQLDDERNGGVFDSTAHVGQIVIEFYFDECPYCNENADNVEALNAEFPGKVIEVSVDCDRSDYTNWFRKHPSTMPTLNDCDGRQLAHRLGAQGYPTTVVLDAGHNVVHRSSGVWNQAVKRRIRSLLSAR